MVTEMFIPREKLFRQRILAQMFHNQSKPKWAIMGPLASASHFPQWKLCSPKQKGHILQNLQASDQISLFISPDEG